MPHQKVEKPRMCSCECYSNHSDDPRRTFSKDEAEPAAGFEDARPPGFPSIEELKELNREIHEDDGLPEHFALDQPSFLESALERASDAYSATAEGAIETASLLAHGIAAAQAFRDGNRRTAYFAVQSFLAANGLAHLSTGKGSDFLLARYLNQVVEPKTPDRVGPDKFAALFRRRLQKGA